MGISLGPESDKKPYRFIVVVSIILLGMALLWWKKDSLSESDFFTREELQIAEGQPVTGLGQNDIVPTPTSFSQVKLVYSTVITTKTAAATADLYLEEAEHTDEADWIGIAERTAVETYTVQAGDTLWGIAVRFELDLDTLRWSNPDLERNPDLLLQGTALNILPVTGVYYTVAEGDTLEAIAARYGVADVDIANYPLNDLLPPYNLHIGNKLVIPNGRKDVSIPSPPEDPDYPLAWPLVGRVTQGYHAGHLAIDIGSVYGVEVYAADRGTVIYAEWARTGYGYTVVIAHDNNLHTLYSHLKGALVHKGEGVARGQAIGAVGSTGKSTGPHVHFEVRDDGERVNPLDYLRKIE